jgi:undecaprenyl diphosphate synthase
MTENNLPIHVAIIPDGNRRWARGRGLQPWKGHEAGADNLKRLIETAHEIGIKCLSFWGSSLENLKKRPFQEKRALLAIYKKYFSQILNDERIERDQVKINFVGRWEEQFPDSLKKIIHKCIDKTKNYRKFVLNFFLAYNGDDEMLDAVKKIAKACVKGRKITAETIKENLMTRDLPPVDLLIRTGGEPHLSAGFMMWDVADSQLYFSMKNFPDFTDAEFRDAIEDYKKRNRRKGK